ncbi:MAG: MFS transporter [Thermofilaceae archaeon]
MSEKERRTKSVLVARQAMASLADNLSAPYLGYYLASLSGSGTLQGILQMSVNSLPTVTQVLAGRWLDRTGRHVQLLLASSLLASTLWLLASLIVDANALVALITARAVTVGVAGLALTSLVGELYNSRERGEVLSYLNLAAQLTALPVFLATMVINPSLGTLRLIFIASGLLSLAASATWLTMLHIKVGGARQSSGPINGRLIENKAFLKFTAANSFYTFAMAIAWPLFPLAQKYVLCMSVADLALLNLLSTTSTTISQYALAKRIQNGKLLKLTLISRAGLIMFPTVYALSPSPAPIFIWQALSGPFTALGAVVIPLYVIEVAEPELKASYLSYYNLAQGLAASAGSALGGLITDRLVEASGWSGVRYGLALSAALRAAALIPLAGLASVRHTIKGGRGRERPN